MPANSKASYRDLFASEKSRFLSALALNEGTRNRGHPEYKGCCHSPAKIPVYWKAPAAASRPGLQAAAPLSSERAKLIWGVVGLAMRLKLGSAALFVSPPWTAPKRHAAISFPGQSHWTEPLPASPMESPLKRIPNHTSAADAVQSPAFPSEEGLCPCKNFNVVASRARGNLPNSTSL